MSSGRFSSAARLRSSRSPDGLTPAAWHYFALFVTVITLIITEPIPPAAIGMAGVTAAAVLGWCTRRRERRRSGR